MEIAHIVSKRSTCFRLNVGAVITVHNRICSIGYNGSPSGEPHCTGNECPGKDGCHLTIHAEDNALRHLPTGLFGRTDMYVTDSPCYNCLEMIMRRCDRLYFDRLYRVYDHLYEAAEKGFKIYQVMPSGYVIDFWTKEILDEK